MLEVLVLSDVPPFSKTGFPNPSISHDIANSGCMISVPSFSNYVGKSSPLLHASIRAMPEMMVSALVVLQSAGAQGRVPKSSMAGLVGMASLASGRIAADLSGELLVKPPLPRRRP